MALTETALIEGHDYSFKQLRQWLRLLGVQEGVWGSGDYKVTAGTLMTVSVAGGDALVQMNTGTVNGLYHQRNDAAIVVAVSGSHATLPRIDQVVLQVRDPNVSGAFDTAQLYVLAGTATSGATLDNRTGATVLPTDHLRFADILVPAASTSITGGNIRDRRLWARGAFWLGTRDTGNVSTGGTSAAIDSTNMAPRIECSGAPLLIRLSGTLTGDSANMDPYLFLQQDGATLGDSRRTGFLASSSEWETLITEVAIVPAAGSHVYQAMFGRTASGSITVLGNTTNAASMVIQELVRPNASNT